MDYLVETVDYDLTGAKVWLDCGYGAASTVARQAFERLGATVEIENCKLRGEKINCGCGALHPDYVLHSMVGTEYKLGFAYDGDADRLSFVFDGRIMDGDSVLYNIGREMTLKDDVVVGTILTNSALERRLEKDGRRLIRTPVGDKYICDLMFKKGYNLGGEQSGHYIVYPQATTGDGIMSSLFLTKTLYKNGKLGEFMDDGVPAKGDSRVCRPIHNVRQGNDRANRGLYDAACGDRQAYRAYVGHGAQGARHVRVRGRAQDRRGARRIQKVYKHEKKIAQYCKFGQCVQKIAEFDVK